MSAEPTTTTAVPGASETLAAKPSEGEVEFYQGTGQWRITAPIKSTDERSQAITLTHPGLPV